MAWDTAGNILNDAAVGLGLYAMRLADPYASTDANVAQLRQFLVDVGQDLAREYQWTHLQREHAFTTVAGTAAYALPSGFARLLDGTEWDRANLMPLRGPLGPQGWQALKALTATGVVGPYFRVFGNQVQLQPTPTSAVALSYEYVSNHWVQPDGQPAPTSETPAAASDVLWFDRRLLVCALKMAFQRAKGFDSTATQQDFERALVRAQGGDGAAPVLSLNRRGRGVERLVDGANLPETGFGQ